MLKKWREGVGDGRVVESGYFLLHTVYLFKLYSPVFCLQVTEEVENTENFGLAVRYLIGR